MALRALEIMDGGVLLLSSHCSSGQLHSYSLSFVSFVYRCLCWNFEFLKTQYLLYPSFSDDCFFRTDWYRNTGSFVYAEYAWIYSNGIRFSYPPWCFNKWNDVADYRKDI